MHPFFVVLIGFYAAMVIVGVVAYLVFAAQGIVAKHNGTKALEGESLPFTVSLNMAMTFGIVIGLGWAAERLGIVIPMDDSPGSMRMALLLIGIAASLSMPVIMASTKLTIRAMYRNVRFRHWFSAQPALVGPQRRFCWSRA